MTTPAAAPLRRPTREQLVAALLVGTVVVLLGFASGLGLGPATVTAAQPGPTGGPAPTGPAPVGTEGPAATTAVPPVAYVVEPVPPAVAPVTVAAVPTSPASGPPAPSSTPAPSTGRTPGSPSPTTPGPPTCSPSLLTALLQLLLPSPPVSGGGLLGLGALLTSITDLARAAGSLLTAPPGQLLDQITGLLGRPRTMSPGLVPASLATSCTADARRALHLVAAGHDVGSAVRAVDR